MNRLEFAITGMHCPSCGMLIDDALEEVAGVIRSQTNMASERTVVDVEDHHVEAARLVEVIVAEGYGARIIG